MLAEESNKEFGWDGCHLKNTCHIDLLFHVNILEAYVQICVRYEDSITKAINGTAVHRWHQQWWWHQWQQQWHTNHDCIGSLACMPNVGCQVIGRVEKIGK